MNIGTKYRKILYELSENARASASEIARKAGVSKDVVNYAINSMIEKKVIKGFVTLVDTERLGFTRYELYIQLKSADKSIAEYLKNHPMFIWVRASLGEWDLLTEFYARDTFEYGKTLQEINSKYKDRIKKTNSAVVLAEYSFPLKSIGYKEEEPIPKHEHKEIKIDKQDMIILGELAKNARMPVTEIAKKTDLSADAVLYRMKNLIKNKIIKGYRAVIDETVLGLSKYKVLLKLKGVDDKTYSTLLSYLKLHKATQYIKKCAGEWDLSITLLASGNDELRSILFDIKNNLKEALEENKILLLFEEHKNTYFPEGLKTQIFKY